MVYVKFQCLILFFEFQILKWLASQNLKIWKFGNWQEAKPMCYGKFIAMEHFAKILN